MNGARSGAFLATALPPARFAEADFLDTGFAVEGSESLDFVAAPLEADFCSGRFDAAAAFPDDFVAEDAFEVGSVSAGVRAASLGARGADFFPDAFTEAFLVETFLVETFFAGTFFAGAFFAGTFFAGTFFAGAFFGRAFFGGAFLAGAFFGGAFLAGAFLAGAFLAGAFLTAVFFAFFAALPESFFDEPMITKKPPKRPSQRTFC